MCVSSRTPPRTNRNKRKDRRPNTAQRYVEQDHAVLNHHKMVQELSCIEAVHTCERIRTTAYHDFGRVPPQDERVEHARHDYYYDERIDGGRHRAVARFRPYTTNVTHLLYPAIGQERISYPTPADVWHRGREAPADRATLLWVQVSEVHLPGSWGQIQIMNTLSHTSREYCRTPDVWQRVN